MKKKIFLAAGAVLVAAAVSVFVCVNNERNSMDELFNANVEALANNEGGGGQCYRVSDYGPISYGVFVIGGYNLHQFIRVHHHIMTGWVV